MERSISQTSITLYNNGYTPIPCKGKAPVIRNWSTSDIDKVSIKNNAELGDNIGIRCGGVMGADFDFYDEDVSMVVQNSFIDRFGRGLIRIGAAPKALMVYRGDGRKLSKVWVDSEGTRHGFELLGEGQQFIAFGVHPDTGLDYRWEGESVLDVNLSDLPLLDRDEVIAWMETIEVPSDWTTVNGVAVGGELGDFEGLLNEPEFKPLGRDEVVGRLSVLDPNMTNDDWVKVGMALYSWDNKKGLKLWDKWSKDGTTYKKGECKKRWQSFKGGVRVGVGTLIMLSRIAGYITQDKISLCQTEAQLMAVGHEIGEDTGLTTLERAKRVSDFQAKYKELTGVKLPIADVRTTLTPARVTTQDAAPQWCNKWLFVTSRDKFVHVRSMQLMGSMGFNNINGRHVPSDEVGKISAVKFVADWGYIKNVSTLEYMPWTTDLVVNGKLNTFDADSVPISCDGDVDLIVAHFTKMIGERDAAILIDWLAWQVQHSGKLLMWCPVIVGREGVGKTFIERVLREALGSVNVGVVTPTLVNSSFNSWAEGVLVNVLSELKVTGHNRYDAANALKPLLTDKTIPIHCKGMSPYVVRNVTNYIAFTNYMDALPVSMGDRRWWLVRAEMPVSEDKSKVYFDALFSLIDKKGVVRNWLENHVISEHFLGLRSAPKNELKDSVIATENTTHSDQAFIVDIIEKGGQQYCKKVVVLADLLAAINSELMLEGERIKKTELIRALKRIGFMQFPTQISFSFGRKWVWVFGKMTKTEIENSL